MTRIACFNNLASLDPNHYVVYDNARDRVAVKTAEQLEKISPASHSWKRREKSCFSNLSSENIRKLSRKSIMTSDLLQQNGKPLQSRHVIWVLDRVDALQATKVKDAPYQPDLDKQLAAVEESVAEFVDAVAAPTGNLLFYTVITEDFRVLYGFQRQRVKPPLLEAPRSS